MKNLLICCRLGGKCLGMQKSGGNVRGKCSSPPPWTSIRELTVLSRLPLLQYYFFAVILTEKPVYGSGENLKDWENFFLLYFFATLGCVNRILACQ